MKIVCIGDLLLTSDMMRRAVEKFPRYTRAEYFSIGPEERSEFRAFIKKMESEGFDFLELPEEICKSLEDADVLQVHTAPVPPKVFPAAKKLKLIEE